MTILLSRIVPRDQIVAVHAPLVDVEWPGTVEFIRATLPSGIRDAGQSPHPAYGMGMSRLSCVFCIMASRADHRTAARLQPALYARYVDLEERIGHTLSPSGRPLPELTGIPVPSDHPLDAPPPLRVRPGRPSERDFSDSCRTRLRRASLRIE